MGVQIRNEWLQLQLQMTCRMLVKIGGRMYRLKREGKKAEWLQRVFRYLDHKIDQIDGKFVE